jgi:hypothetical protein
MVEKGFVTEQDFREFTFTNAAMLHTRNNPGFFKSTVVEQAVADELGLERASPAATAKMTLLGIDAESWEGNKITGKQWQE